MIQRGWTLENDEEGWQGGFGQSLQQFENYLIRDEDTDNRDVVAIIPKIGDEEWDNSVTYENAKLVRAAKELLDACRSAHNWLREYHVQNGSPMDEGVRGLLSQMESAMRDCGGPLQEVPKSFVPVYQLEDVQDQIDDRKPQSHPLSVKVDAGGEFIAFDIAGCGLRDMETGDGRVVLLENRRGKPILMVWADINDGNPTDEIDLSGALESERIED